MKVRDAMTQNPIVCGTMSSLRLAAQLMAEHDCAALPVTDSGKVVGIITDRDITCRGVATTDDTSNLTVSECMTKAVITVGPDDPIDKAAQLMEENTVHHLPVIREDGTLVGMIAQSDLGRRMTNREFGALARMTSIRSRFARKFGSALVRREH